MSYNEQCCIKNIKAAFYCINRITCIIDEILMVSVRTFHSIHKRLFAIADNSRPSGGFNIFLFWGFLSTPTCMQALLIQKHRSLVIV